MQHVLFAIRQQSLHDRLTSVLNFSKYEPRTHFRGFLEHAIRLAETFQILYAGINTNYASINTNSDGDGSGSNSISDGGRRD